MSTTTKPATPYALGAYVGTPDDSSAAGQAAYQADEASFSALMGVEPSYMDDYVDYRQPISQWVGNAGFAATSIAQSPVDRGVIPVIGLPMYSNAAGASTPDQTYQDWISGKYDSVLQGIVKDYVGQGMTTLYFRPGWEMNLEGPTYAGDGTPTGADWVKAFQHISTVLHAAGAAQGADVQIVWNPGTTNYSNAGIATQTLYPGNQYVDVIGADTYGDVYPYGASNAIYDWDRSGQVYNSAHPVFDTSIAQWASDPVNLAHYYTNPASTQYSADGSTGHSLSLGDLIAFAKAQGKPIAMVETGAGNTGDGANITDNPTFVHWLASTLKSSGVAVKFVNIWDSNGGGSYEFSQAGDNKPNEAAAWAQEFGVQPASTGTTTTPVSMPTAPVTIGSGSDSIILGLSEDAYQGDAQVSLSVDGVAVGGVQTIVASHAMGASQLVTIQGNWGNGTHTVGVDFVNDAYGGSAATDRNAYVSSASYDGVASTGATLGLLSSGTQTLVVGTAVPPILSVGTGVDTISLRVSEDAYMGDAQYTVAVDGKQVGGTLSAQASHAAGKDQVLNVLGNFGAGTHQVAVDFLNDAYGGTSTTDRNLYVDGASIDAVASTGATLALMSGGSQSLGLTTPPPANALPISLGAGSDAIDLAISGDAYQGNPQFMLSVDGVAVGGVQTASAIHASGADQDFILRGNWSSGTHDVGVDFLNDAYAGTPATDRNLYVDGASLDGLASTGGKLSLMSSGTQTLQVVHADTLVLNVSEDAYQGDAQYVVTVDGKQVGGTMTATASHAAGASQSVTLLGSWGLGSHTVGVDFINDAYGGTTATDRNLYLNSVTYDAHATVANQTFLNNGTQNTAVVSSTLYNTGVAGGAITTLGADSVIAGQGADTINAQGPQVSVVGGMGSMVFVAHGGADTIQGGTGAMTAMGSTGAMTFMAGKGSAVLGTGAGALTLDFVAGHAGGNVVVSGFRSGTDIVHLQGYQGSGIASQSIAGGSAQYTLSDGSKLTLSGIGTLQPTHPVFG